MLPKCYKSKWKLYQINKQFTKQQIQKQKQQQLQESQKMGKSSKLCGCADYTISTTVIGALMTVLAIIRIVVADGNPYAFIYIWTIIFGAACAATIFLRHNILYRKITLGMFCLEILILLVQICLWIYNCVVISEMYGSSALTTYIFVGLVVFAINIAFLALLGACLVGGLRVELEAQAQQANAPSQPKQVVVAGKAVDVVAEPRDPANQINAI